MGNLRPLSVVCYNVFVNTLKEHFRTQYQQLQKAFKISLLLAAFYWLAIMGSSTALLAEIPALENYAPKSSAIFSALVMICFAAFFVFQCLSASSSIRLRALVIDVEDVALTLLGTTGFLALLLFGNLKILIYLPIVWGYFIGLHILASINLPTSRLMRILLALGFGAQLLYVAGSMIQFFMRPVA